MLTKGTRDGRYFFERANIAEHKNRSMDNKIRGGGYFREVLSASFLTGVSVDRLLFSSDRGEFIKLAPDEIRSPSPPM